jgi:hypothetical protein
MNFYRTIRIVIFAIAAAIARGEGLVDRIDENLSFSGYDDQLRVHFSGLLDVEYYQFSGDAPGLIFTDGSQLWNPRLTLFCDAQFGPELYFFAQARVDRGFDPADEPLEAGMEEFALRWSPWEDGRFSMQLGRFATVVGNSVERHLSWENPFITAPLIYENMTGIRDSGPPRDPEYFGRVPADYKYAYNPVIWGPSYASGLSLSGRFGKIDYAAEVKNAGLSSRPESWDIADRGFDDPTVSARLGYRPEMAWNLGFSGSVGPYYTDEARAALPPGHGLGDYREIVLGQDLSYAWGHWQLWAEVYEARFEVPNVGDADTLGYYLEAKYKFTPNLFGALRWNQQFFADVPSGTGYRHPWGNDISRIDTAVTYRFTPSSQLKIQYSLQHQDRVEDGETHLVAAQFTVRF